MKKIKSLFKKAINLDEEAYKEGLSNYTNQNAEFEIKAMQRAEICGKCDELKTEPVDFLRVKDNIAVISGKMCNACGCTSSYLLRQDIKGCKLGKW